MKTTLFFFILSYFICLPQDFYSQENTYPTKERLFHVEKSKNKNIVCYDINLKQDNQWNISDPVKIYWVNREETPGKTNGLSAIQKKLAYGYKLRYHKDDSCVIALNACSDKHITITKKGDKYSCVMTINNQQVILNKVYVQAKKHNSLSVDYVELYGTDLQTGKLVSERISK